MNILLVYPKDISIQSFQQTLAEETGAEVAATESTSEALQQIKDGAVDAVAVAEQLEGMSGVAFVEQLIKVNPLVNAALSSSLAPGAFHEATEGQGVLLQLAVNPDAGDARQFVEKLTKVTSLL